jgi:hypothetical protein
MSPSWANWLQGTGGDAGDSLNCTAANTAYVDAREILKALSCSFGMLRDLREREPSMRGQQSMCRLDICSHRASSNFC